MGAIMSSIGQETIKAFELAHGHTVVGSSRETIIPENFTAVKGILLRCPGIDDPIPNTAPIWIGKAGVTADSGVSGGMPILPGASLFLPTANPIALYAISPDEDQDLPLLSN